jgi:hypothetical protein
MQWEVTGANRETGEVAVVSIDAWTREDAEADANKRGLLVSSVAPMPANYVGMTIVAYLTTALGVIGIVAGLVLLVFEYTRSGPPLMVGSLLLTLAGLTSIAIRDIALNSWRR